jgi:hypothetical protein
MSAMSHNDLRTMLEYALPFLKAHRINEVITTAIPTIRPDVLDQVAQKFIATLKPEAVKNFNGRLERGLELAKSGAVIACTDPAHPRCFQVRSTDGKSSYRVDLDDHSCECPDSQKGFFCKHRIAAYYVEQAGKIKPVQPVPAAAPVKPVLQTIAPALKPVSREDQILKELGFDAEPKKLAETAAPQPSIRLGNLYRRYLHGEDLDQKPVKVTITDITKETVTPHPSQPSYEKWCLWVTGLPQAMPCGILFGPQGDKDLVAIFGRVEINSLKGKALVIYPQPMNVAGQSRIAIRFKRAQ